MKDQMRKEVRSGIRRAGGWLLGICWFGLVLWGILEAFGTEANFSVGHHPSRALGYVLLSIAGIIFVVTANLWKRVFPGIMLFATLGSLLELERGHAVNSSSIVIPRWISSIQLIVVAGVMVLSFTFKNRPLNILDRLALLVFTASIFYGGMEATRQEVPLALIVGGLCIFFVWLVDRLKAKTAAS